MAEKNITTTTVGDQPKRRLVLPWKTRITLSILNLYTDVSSRRDGTVDRRADRLFSTIGLKTPANPKSVRGVTSSDVTIDASRNLWYRIFTPTAGAADSPVVVFFHGGGFVHLGPDFKSYDIVCRRFAAEINAVVVSVNYRLAPENRYPAQYDDGFDVLKYLDKNVAAATGDVTRCFLAGDSAGGNLAHHVAKRAAECKSDFTRLKVIGVVAIQPFFGGMERTKSELELDRIDPLVSITRTDFMWNAFMSSGMDRDHEVINVSGPNAADITKLDFPPTMVVAAGFDSLRDWQTRYYEWLIKSGKEAVLFEYPTMFHAFYIFPELPESSQVIAQVKEFVHAQCSKVASQ